MRELQTVLELVEEQPLDKTAIKQAYKNQMQSSPTIKVAQQVDNSPMIKVGANYPKSLTVEPFPVQFDQAALDVEDPFTAMFNELLSSQANPETTAEIIKVGLDKGEQIASPQTTEDKLVQTLVSKSPQQEEEVKEGLVLSKSPQTTTKDTSFMQVLKDNALPITLGALGLAVFGYAFSYSGAKGTVVNGLPKGKQSKKPQSKGFKVGEHYHSVKFK